VHVPTEHLQEIPLKDIYVEFSPPRNYARRKLPTATCQ
jgi:hypothetical protein